MKKTTSPTRHPPRQVLLGALGGVGSSHGFASHLSSFGDSAQEGLKWSFAKRVSRLTMYKMCMSERFLENRWKSQCGCVMNQRLWIWGCLQGLQFHFSSRGIFWPPGDLHSLMWIRVLHESLSCQTSLARYLVFPCESLKHFQTCTQFR